MKTFFLLNLSWKSKLLIYINLFACIERDLLFGFLAFLYFVDLLHLITSKNQGETKLPLQVLEFQINLSCSIFK